MNIAILDADLISKPHHNFPNLALLKISGYHKNRNDTVTLITNFSELNPFFSVNNYDRIYMSKVFTDSEVPSYILKLPNIEYGGTGFFYDKAPKLPDEIEHHFPDYNLYDTWIKQSIKRGKKKEYFKYYTDYSIGFVTRGCFRRCGFCVNKNFKRVFPHSPLSEFVDPTRKKICLLDDNFFGCGQHWERILKELQATKKPFQFKQGLDIRILSDKKAKMLSESKYDDRPYFAFDNIEDKTLIESKLQLLNKYYTTRKHIAILYVLSAFDRTDTYDQDFWVQDIIDIFERLSILMKYKCSPYVMRHANWINSPFKSLYSHIVGWSNMPHLFTQMSFRENLKLKSIDISDFEKQYPEIVEKYFDLKFK